MHNYVFIYLLVYQAILFNLSVAIVPEVVVDYNSADEETLLILSNSNGHSDPWSRSITFDPIHLNE